MFYVCLCVFACWMKPAVASFALNVRLQGVRGQSTGAHGLPPIVVRLENFLLGVELSPCEEGVWGCLAEGLKLRQRHQLTAPIDSLNVNILIVICSKQFDVVCNLCQLPLR